MLRIPYEQVVEVLDAILRKNGFAEVKAARLAEIFATNSLEGIYSHGVNRFARFVTQLQSGWIDPSAEPVRISGLGGLEIWDGQLGPGPLNAEQTMARAVELARTSGIACIALRNTNHWMRGGSYGLQAAESGMMAICWTNTMPNMPMWGAKDPRIGNNPLVMAIPRSKGHVLLDTAMSQFAYGKLETAAVEGRMLPIDGGFDTKGNITRDPGEILKSQRILPAGYWKGASMSVLLDLMASGICLGQSTYAMSGLDEEYSLTQIFIAINYAALVDPQKVDELADETIRYILASEPERPGVTIRYPGQAAARYRTENLEKGIPIPDATWAVVQDLR